jgi:hypothetical protein
MAGTTNVPDENDPHERDKAAQDLLRRMVAAGVSRYEPDPLITWPKPTASCAARSSSAWVISTACDNLSQSLATGWPQKANLWRHPTSRAEQLGLHKPQSR